MSDRSQFHPSNMRKRFHELTAQAAAIEAGSAPLRAQRDALVASHEAARKELDARLKKAEEGLFDIQIERGVLVRALNGKTGKPDGSA